MIAELLWRPRQGFEENINITVKPIGLTKKVQFYTDIFMVIFVLTAQLSNIHTLLFTKSTSSTIFASACFGLLCFSLFISTRSLVRDLKERREMKQKGEEFCNICKGSRTLNIITTSKNPETNEVKKKKDWATCNKCNGTGKIDWVQKVIDPRRLP